MLEVDRPDAGVPFVQPVYSFQIFKDLYIVRISPLFARLPIFRAARKFVGSEKPFKAFVVAEGFSEILHGLHHPVFAVLQLNTLRLFGLRFFLGLDFLSEKLLYLFHCCFSSFARRFIIRVEKSYKFLPSVARAGFVQAFEDCFPRRKDADVSVLSFVRGVKRAALLEIEFHFSGSV